MTAQNVQNAYDRLRAAATHASVPSLEERDDRLARLEKLLVKERETFVEAISEDFSGRSRGETLSADVLLSLDGVRFARKHLAEWMKNKKNKPLKPAPGAEGAGGRGASGEVATSARVGRTGWPVRLSRPEGRRMPGAAGRAEVHYTPSAS